MRKHIPTLIIIMLSLLLYNGTFWLGECQFTTGDGVNEKVDIEINIDRENTFEYLYTVTNLPDSRQKLMFLKLLLNYEYYSEAMRQKLVIDEDKVEKRRKFLWPDRQELLSNQYHIKNLIEAYEKKKPYDISIIVLEPLKAGLEPGEYHSVSIKVTHYGMPSVVDYYAEGESSIICYCSKPYCGEEVEAQYGGNYPGYSDLTPYGPGKVGKTIGPGIFPEDLNGHISKLKDEIKKSYGIGWIKDSESRDSLINMLSSIENTFKFKKNRAKVINEVIDSILEMKENSQIKNEVYQMLRAHLIYLRGKK